MRKLFILSFLFLSSCAPVKRYPIKGYYGNTPYQAVVDKPFDYVWDRAIDFFTQAGISIKTLEKASGVIIAERTNLIKDVNYEDIKTGKINNQAAWVVLETIREGPREFKATHASGDWNVRVKKIGGQTEVTVNLVNIQASDRVFGFNFEGKSTGVFEKSVIEYVTK